MSRRAPGLGRPVLALVLALAVAILLTACADAGLAELDAYAERVMARPPEPLEPIPAITLADPFLYRSGDRRDPFMMDDQAAEQAAEQVADVVQERRSSGLSPDLRRSREPLEDYPLDALRMVGTLEQHGTRWALVTSPDGTLHRVRVGQYLGLNHGRITRVEPNQLVLTEMVETQPGQWEQRQASVTLP